jgi:hypothetical protein
MQYVARVLATHPPHGIVFGLRNVGIRVPPVAHDSGQRRSWIVTELPKSIEVPDLARIWREAVPE